MTTLVAYLLLFLVVGCFFVFIHLFIGKQIRPARPHAEKLTIYECGEPTIGSAWIQFDLRFYVVALLFVIFDVEVAFFFPWAVVFGKATALASQPLPTTPEEKQRYLGLAYDLIPPYPENRRVRRELKEQVGEWGSLPREKQALEAQQEKLIEERNDLVTKTLRPLEARKRKLEQKKDAADAKELEQVNAELAATDVRGAELTQQLRLRASVMKLREPAQKLAWIAFWDIVVFFGVLLVGFAYLWKRGDLEWVRSTAAETEGASADAMAVAEGERGNLAGAGR